MELPGIDIGFNGTEYFIFERPSMKTIWSSSAHGEAAKYRAEAKLREILKGMADPQAAICTIKLTLEKVIVTRRAVESTDIQRADCDALRKAGYEITGLSFFYEGNGKVD